MGRSRRGRAGKIATGVLVGSLGVGVSACSSGRHEGDGPHLSTTTTVAGASSASIRQQLTAFATSAKPVEFLESAVRETPRKIETFDTGYGASYAAAGIWQVNVLPANSSNLSFEQKLLEVGGTAYASAQALTVALPNDNWFTLTGDISPLAGSTLVQLGVSPAFLAKIILKSGASLTRGQDGAVNNQRVPGYEATVPASTVAHAIAASGEPASYQAIARTLVANQAVHFYVWANDGKVLALGYNTKGQGSVQGSNVTFYPLTRPASPKPAKPTSGVVTYQQFVSALAQRYQTTTTTTQPGG